MTATLTGPPAARQAPPDRRVLARIEALLGEFLDARAAGLAVVGPELDAVAAATRRFVLGGGKRLRPRFAYWGWRTVRDDDGGDTELLPAAASLELLHACALVHDDIMDASATRRGTRATHARFADLHRDNGWPGDPQRFGTAAAILIGDLLLSWADTLFASAQLPPGPLLAARDVYDRMRQLVIAGQYLDVLVQSRGGFSIDDALRVARFKTSTYTVDGPLRLGATTAGAPPEVLAALADYGTAIGEAFQLRDDVLGVFGDSSRTGKPAGDDLREGKRTLLVALAMRSASAVEAELLRHELGDRTVSADGVAALREVIVRTGALDRVERRILERTEQALCALGIDAIGAAARTALAGLALAATQRQL